MREDGDVVKTRDDELDDFVQQQLDRLTGTEHEAEAIELAVELATRRQQLAAYQPVVNQLKVAVSTTANALGSLGAEL